MQSFEEGPASRSFSRRAFMLAVGALASGCGMVKLGGPGAGGSAPGGGGATIDHVRRVNDEALRPKKAKLEDSLRVAVLLSAGREAVPMAPGKPLPLGTSIARHRGAGAKIAIEPMLDTVSLSMRVDTMNAKPGVLTWEQTRGLEEAFRLLESFTDRVRVEAITIHLDVLLLMLSWRRDGGALGGEEVEVFRQGLAIARGVDTLSALGVSALAMIQAVVANKAKPEALDAFFAKTADAFPIEGTATTEETKALYEALPGSLEAAIRELERVTRERLPGPFKESISKKLGQLFQPYVELARQAEGQPGGEAPAPTNAAASGGNITETGAAVGAALLEQGSALFPGLGVALKGYEAAGALLEGMPGKAIEVAASMVPAGTVALRIVQESAKVLGVKLPLIG